MIRYPGSKEKIVRQIKATFPDALRIGGLFQQPHLEYREPFFGAGAIGFAILRNLASTSTIWLNDRDYGLRCFWGAVYDVPEELIARIRTFSPSVKAFLQFKSEDLRCDLDVVEIGFRKLALHQMSFSGLGAKAGGPIGGLEQSSQYNVECRWNPSRLCRHICARHSELRRFAEVRITAYDFGDVIKGAPASAFIYADPPYVAKGPELYKHSMGDADHRRLAALLYASRAPWVLSYDDHPLVHELYGWAHIDRVSLTYTTARAQGLRRKNAEVVISPTSLERRVLEWSATS